MSIAHKLEDRTRTDDVMITETIDFPGLLLSKPVLQGLAAGGFQRPSPIQLKAIPLGRCGLDLIVQAKSGTGKTCVFTVIALENIDISSVCVQVLVLAPTREIAQQIQEVIRVIGGALHGLKCHTFIGGLPVLQDKILGKNCHIAVGTPGRVKQLLEIGALKANSIRLFVLDEADKLLEESFQESINWIYSMLPENKQMLALSATYPEYLAQHLTAYMRNPTFVRLNATDPALLGIKQYHLAITYHPMPNITFNAKIEAVLNIISNVSFQQCLIFSNMQTRAQDLQSELQARNWPTACIAGCLDQKDRSFAMDQLKTYKCRILISTDLTSRGIDADKVNLVINLDVPPDHETYLHRIGRAGRFGSFGAAVTIVSKGPQEKDLWRIEKLCKTYIHKLPEPIPKDLVTMPVPIHLEDMVTTEQIINYPDQSRPQAEDSGSSQKDIMARAKDRNGENTTFTDTCQMEVGEATTVQSSSVLIDVTKPTQTDSDVTEDAKILGMQTSCQELGQHEPDDSQQRGSADQSITEKIAVQHALCREHSFHPFSVREKDTMQDFTEPETMGEIKAAFIENAAPSVDKQEEEDKLEEKAKLGEIDGDTEHQAAAFGIVCSLLPKNQKSIEHVIQEGLMKKLPYIGDDNITLNESSDIPHSVLQDGHIIAQPICNMDKIGVEVSSPHFDETKDVIAEVGVGMVEQRWNDVNGEEVHDFMQNRKSGIDETITTQCRMDEDVNSEEFYVDGVILSMKDEDIDNNEIIIKSREVEDVSIETANIFETIKENKMNEDVNATAGHIDEVIQSRKTDEVDVNETIAQCSMAEDVNSDEVYVDKNIMQSSEHEDFDDVDIDLDETTVQSMKEVAVNMAVLSVNEVMQSQKNFMSVTCQEEQSEEGSAVSEVVGHDFYMQEIDRKSSVEKKIVTSQQGNGKRKCTDKIDNLTDPLPIVESEASKFEDDNENYKVDLDVKDSKVFVKRELNITPLSVSSENECHHSAKLDMKAVLDKTGDGEDGIDSVSKALSFLPSEESGPKCSITSMQTSLDQDITDNATPKSCSIDAFVPDSNVDGSYTECHHTLECVGDKPLMKEHIESIPLCQAGEEDVDHNFPSLDSFQNGYVSSEEISTDIAFYNKVDREVFTDLKVTGQSEKEESLGNESLSSIAENAILNRCTLLEKGGDGGKDLEKCNAQLQNNEMPRDDEAPSSLDNHLQDQKALGGCVGGNPIECDEVENLKVFETTSSTSQNDATDNGNSDFSKKKEQISMIASCSSNDIKTLKKGEKLPNQRVCSGAHGKSTAFSEQLNEHNSLPIALQPAPIFNEAFNLWKDYASTLAGVQDCFNDLEPNQEGNVEDSTEKELPIIDSRSHYQQSPSCSKTEIVFIEDPDLDRPKELEKFKFTNLWDHLLGSGDCIQQPNVVSAFFDSKEVSLEQGDNITVELSSNYNTLKNSSDHIDAALTENVDDSVQETELPSLDNKDDSKIKVVPGTNSKKPRKTKSFALSFFLERFSCEDSLNSVTHPVEQEREERVKCDKELNIQMEVGPVEKLEPEIQIKCPTDLQCKTYEIVEESRDPSENMPNIESVSHTVELCSSKANQTFLSMITQMHQFDHPFSLSETSRKMQTFCGDSIRPNCKSIQSLMLSNSVLEDSPNFESYCDAEEKKVETIRIWFEREQKAAYERRQHPLEEKIPLVREDAPGSRSSNKITSAFSQECSFHSESQRDYTSAKSEDKIVQQDAVIAAREEVYKETKNEQVQESLESGNVKDESHVLGESTYAESVQFRKNSKHRDMDASKEECSKLDEMHEEMLRRRKLRKAAKAKGILQQLDKLEIVKHDTEQKITGLEVNFAQNEPRNSEIKPSPNSPGDKGQTYVGQGYIIQQPFIKSYQEVTPVHQHSPKDINEEVKTDERTADVSMRLSPKNVTAKENTSILYKSSDKGWKKNTSHAGRFNTISNHSFESKSSKPKVATRPSKPSKSKARWAGIEVSDGPTSPSSTASSTSPQEFMYTQTGAKTSQDYKSKSYGWDKNVQQAKCEDSNSSSDDSSSGDKSVSGSGLPWHGALDQHHPLFPCDTHPYSSASHYYNYLCMYHSQHRQRNLHVWAPSQLHSFYDQKLSRGYPDGNYSVKYMPTTSWNTLHSHQYGYNPHHFYRSNYHPDSCGRSSGERMKQTAFSSRSNLVYPWHHSPSWYLQANLQWKYVEYMTKKSTQLARKYLECGSKSKKPKRPF